jgi:hypothetical protein
MNFFQESVVRRLCPSVQELKAFEAAARHMSVTRAATELCVTQGGPSSFSVEYNIHNWRQ